MQYRSKYTLVDILETKNRYWIYSGDNEKYEKIIMRFFALHSKLSSLTTVDITSHQLAHKYCVCHFIKILILHYCYMQLYWPKNEFRKLNVILWMAKNFVVAYYWNSYFALGIRTAIGFEYQSCIWEFRKCSIPFSDNIIIQHRLKNTTSF